MFASKASGDEKPGFDMKGTGVINRTLMGWLLILKYTAGKGGGIDDRLIYSANW